jgi:hypothetical protein
VVVPICGSAAGSQSVLEAAMKPFNSTVRLRHLKMVNGKQLAHG